MDLDNREASYEKCVVEKTTPNVYFAPEKDNAWYNGYYCIDMNKNRVEFSFGVSKNY